MRAARWVLWCSVVLGMAACSSKPTVSGKHEELPNVASQSSALLGPRVWSKSIGDPVNQYTWSVAVDTAGKVWATGEFSGTVDFGAPCTALSAADGSSVYLVQLDGSGSCQWARAFTDAQTPDANQYGRSLALDSAGNAYVTGYFYGAINLGGTPDVGCGRLTPPPPGDGADVFLAKFDSTGTCLWGKTFGVDGQNKYGRSVAVDGQDNVWVTGDFRGWMRFAAGLDPVGRDAGGTQIFLASFDSSGTHRLSKKFGDSPADHTSKSVAARGLDVVLGGYFKGRNLDFGDGTDVLATAGDANDIDIFLVKFNNAGVAQWSRRYGDATANQYGESVALDGAGNILLTGSFGGNVNFAGSGDGLSTTGPSDSDVFVAKLDPSAAHQWSKKFGDNANQFGTSVGLDSSNNVLLTGYFFGAVNFTGRVEDELRSQGETDIFIAKFDANGTPFGSGRYGDTDFQFGRSIAAAPNGDVVLVGEYKGSVDFGGLVHTSRGGTDGYLVQFSRGCDPANCASGCCDGATCATNVFPSVCGLSGISCFACDPIRADTCGADSCQCGGNSQCPAGQHCVGGNCRCDDVVCADGCCNGVTCTRPRSFPASCRAGGGTTCAACDTTRGDNCGTDGSCRCGSTTQCPSGQHCFSGNCRCDDTVCADGCCNGLTCTRPRSFPASCRAGGGTTCAACDTTRADNCNTDGSCRCGGSAQCSAAQRCVNGACCAGCVSGSTCQPGTQDSACGVGGVACVQCPTDYHCQNGACVYVDPCPHCTDGTRCCSPFQCYRDYCHNPACSVCGDGRECCHPDTCGPQGHCGGPWCGQYEC